MTSSAMTQHTTPSGIPAADGLLFIAIVLTGAVAAYVALPMLWIVTPVMAGLVYFSARQASFVPAPAIELAGELPPHVQYNIYQAIDRLPLGEPRQLLANVVRQARPLFAERQSAFDAETERETRANVIALVNAACETALDLWRLDGAAPRVSSGADIARGDLGVRYQRAREELVARLRDAATSLSELYASDLEHGTPASDRVAELAAALREDAVARSAAKNEVDMVVPRTVRHEVDGPAASMIHD